MKTMKKLLALLLALTMVFALATTAFAASSSDADKFTITIKNDSEDVSIAGKKFNAYKIFDVTYDGDMYTYTFVDAIAALKKPAEGEQDTGYFHIDVPNGDGTTTTYWGDREMNPPDYSKNPVVDTSILAYLENTGDDSAHAVKFADAMLQWLTDHKIDATQVLAMDEEGDETEEKTFEMEAGAGYYLVTGYARDVIEDKDIASAVILTTTNPDAEISPKVEPLTITKEATDHLLDTAGKAAESEVGKDVPYKITTQVPNLTSYETFTLMVTDTMSEGLTYLSNTLNVKIDTQDCWTVDDEDHEQEEQDTDPFFYTVAKTTDPKTNETQIVIDFPNIIDIEEEYYEKDITITYTCTVNGNALNYNWEENTATVSYGRDHDDLTTSTPKKVYVYDFDIEVNKFYKDASKEEQALAGASFVLRRNPTAAEIQADSTLKTTDYLYYKFTPGDSTAVPATEPKVEWIKLDGSDDEWDHKEYAVTDNDKNKGITVETSDEDGKALFQGLMTGEYQLVEVKAPDGYNMLLDAISVEIHVELKTDGSGEIDYGNKNTTIDAPDPDDERGEGQLVLTPDVENKYGKLLPTTGGMGTTIFYVLGSVMMIGAAVLLVAKKRTSI